MDDTSTTTVGCSRTTEARRLDQLLAELTLPSDQVLQEGRAYG
jgi:hypothetical protein